MKTLSIDIETYSDVPLQKTGVYRYVESPNFEILLFAYSVDSQPVQVIDLACGEHIPKEVLLALEDETVIKWAFNATFERICISRFLGYPTGEYLEPESWRCSMIWAATMGLPLSLEGVGAVLGLEKQKLSEGKDLIKYFCQPCPPTKTNGQRTRNRPFHAPDKWAMFKKYNIRNVETEMGIQQRLAKFPVPDFIWDEYHIEQEINDATNEQMNRNQREYFLREQMKVIQQELGEDDSFDDIGEYRKKIRALKLSPEIEEKFLKEVSHLAKQPFGSTEATVIRGYLDTCLELPWNTKTEETDDIELARKMLDEDHFGLEKVKERVIEYLAVRKLAPKATGSLLCLVGPPGTGKTSIAMSIARATNRNLVRISLGGVHDEAEIRGHRKTYVGSMPGRIIGGIKQAKSSNPLMVLDEIDKLGSDYRGDPSAALLEALDPEQNKTFRDNFLEVPYDLSDVFFITTANTTSTIPRALLDRMEIIELSSYTDMEKLSIAKNYLLPKQRKKHGLKAAQLKISDDAIREIISLYTRESGVRGLERQIGTICRKTAVAIARGERKSLSLRAGMLKPYLGAEKFKPESRRNTDEVGLVRGLAWTSVGGEVLDVEVAVLDGSGKIELTGNLGNVMKESCQAAVTFIRSRAKALGIDEQFYKNKDIHIHFPEGAVPKDGPSAGITVCTAIASALTGRPVRRDIAMTGEISLRGRVLPIGGLKEKTMAALRNGVNTVIVPADNEPDLDEIDPTVKSALNFVLADKVDKVLDIALLPKADEPKVEAKAPRAAKKPRSDIRQ